MTYGVNITFRPWVIGPRGIVSGVHLECAPSQYSIFLHRCNPCNKNYICGIESLISQRCFAYIWRNYHCFAFDETISGILVTPDTQGVVVVCFSLRLFHSETILAATCFCGLKFSATLLTPGPFLVAVYLDFIDLFIVFVLFYLFNY